MSLLDVTGSTDDRWPQADDILSWNTNKIPSYTAPQKFLKVKPKQEPGVAVPENNSMTNNNNVSISSVQIKQPQSSASLQSLTNLTPKRYSCSSCPYSTGKLYFQQFLVHLKFIFYFSQIDETSSLATKTFIKKKNHSIAMLA